MEELKIYSWDMEQLRTLASLADIQPELRDAMINVGKKIMDGIEPADKKVTLNPAEKIRPSDYAKTPVSVAREDLERLKFIDRMMLLPGIESGSVRVSGNASYIIPPQYVIKLGNSAKASPSV